MSRFHGTQAPICWRSPDLKNRNLLCFEMNRTLRNITEVWLEIPEVPTSNVTGSNFLLLDCLVNDANFMYYTAFQVMMNNIKTNLHLNPISQQLKRK